MTDELFATLGIELNQPLERVREALEEKNLEYLERLGNCTDEARAAELRATQTQIEAAIQGLADGTLTLPEPAPGAAAAPAEAPKGAKAPTKEELALKKGMQLLEAQDLTGAMSILKPLADQGSAAGCILTAEVYKRQGDDANHRRYLFNAAKGGSGDGALLLAQDYFAKGEADQAKKWAEKAHELQTPGAGQLLLRLLGEEKKYGEALELAAAEIEWLPDFELFALCTDLKDLLNKGLVRDDVIVRMVGPMVRTLGKKPGAQKLLDEPYQAALDRERKREAKAEQERKAKELAEQQRKEKAAREQAVFEQQMAQWDAEEKKENAKKARRKLAWVVWLFLPPILAAVAHWFVGPFRGNGGLEAVLRMTLTPAAAGAICGMTTWLLSGGCRSPYTGNGAVKEFFLLVLFSDLANFAMFMGTGLVAKSISGSEYLTKLNVPIGPFVINGDNCFAIGACIAYYIVGLIGIKHGHGD